MYFEMSSVPMQKYIQNVNMGTGVITNLLSKIIYSRRIGSGQCFNLERIRFAVVIR